MSDGSSRCILIKLALLSSCRQAAGKPSPTKKYGCLSTFFGVPKCPASVIISHLLFAVYVLSCLHLMNLKTLTLFVFGAFSLAYTSQAVLIVYEGFSYPV